VNHLLELPQNTNILGEHFYAQCTIMQHILGQQIQFTCKSLYLGDLPEGITGNDRYLREILTVAAKKSITGKLLQTDPPSTENWTEIIKEIHEMERMIFLLRLRRDIYTARWTKWTKYVKIRKLASDTPSRTSQDFGLCWRRGSVSLKKTRIMFRQDATHIYIYI